MKKIIYILVALSLIGMVSAGFDLVEDATETNCINEVCDGDYTTSNNALTTYYFNYTSQKKFAIWQVKTSFRFVNYTLPDVVWNQDKIQLKIVTREVLRAFIWGAEKFYWQPVDEEWVLIENDLIIFSLIDVFEEAMYFDNGKYGSPLVSNSGFDSADNWVFGSSWSHESSNDAWKVFGADFGTLSQVVTIKPNTDYIVQVNFIHKGFQFANISIGGINKIITGPIGFGDGVVLTNITTINSDPLYIWAHGSVVNSPASTVIDDVQVWEINPKYKLNYKFLAPDGTKKMNIQIESDEPIRKKSQISMFIGKI